MKPERKKILVAVCGIGDPRFDAKLPHNIKNIEIINHTAPKEYNGNIDFLFFSYDNRLQKKFINHDNCKIIKEEGFVGEFIYRHLQPEMVSNYDRIIVMLDDLAVQKDFNLEKIMKIQDEYNLETTQ